MRHYQAFDVFFAGATCFIAGIAVTLAMRSGPWTRGDTAEAATAAILLGHAAMTLRGLYRAQVDPPRSSPRMPAA